MGIYWILERELPGTTDLPVWYLLVERFGVWEPLGAIASALVDIAGDVPFFLETWFAWVFVAAWIIVPFGIGYYRFNRAVLS